MTRHLHMWVLCGGFGVGSSNGAHKGDKGSYLTFKD